MIVLDGRTALVTGGSRGIGRAVAVTLARAGADVAIGYRSRGAGGSVVLVSSTAGQRGEAGHADYAATPAFGGGEKERIAGTIPLRRIPSAEEIAGPVVFL